MWNPNTWEPDDHEYRIYGDDNAQTWAVVSKEDYQWALSHRWCLVIKKSRRNPLKIKKYMRRAVAIYSGGVRVKTVTVYLHLEILRRAVGEPPGPDFVIGDHRSGDSLDCRRENLRWATHAMNVRNRYGQHPGDFFDVQRQSYV
jgi:hypothetical protein